MNFLIGIVCIGAGFWLVWKTQWVLNNFGRIDYFEQKLAMYGGSRAAWKLLGVIVIFIGFLLITGLWGRFVTWSLSPLIKLNQ